MIQSTDFLTRFHRAIERPDSVHIIAAPSDYRPSLETTHTIKTLFSEFRKPIHRETFNDHIDLHIQTADEQDTK